MTCWFHLSFVTSVAHMICGCTVFFISDGQHHKTGLSIAAFFCVQMTIAGAVAAVAEGAFRENRKYASAAVAVTGCVLSVMCLAFPLHAHTIRGVACAHVLFAVLALPPPPLFIPLKHPHSE